MSFEVLCREVLCRGRSYVGRCYVTASFLVLKAFLVICLVPHEMAEYSRETMYFRAIMKP